MFSLSNKTAVITGAGSGIGRAIAVLFAKQGAKVEVLDYNTAQADEVVAEIQAAGGTASAVMCDISSSASVKAAFESVATRHSRIDILVNNAGIAHIGTALTTKEEDLDRLYNVNVKGRTSSRNPCCKA